MVAGEIQELLNTVGEPLAVTELPAGDSYFPFSLTDVEAFVAVYAFPIALQTTGGILVAQAKWINIRWSIPGKPDYVIYGTTPYSPEGAFGLTGDTFNLELFANP